MKVLFLAPKSPIPPSDGGSLRNYNILKRVAKRHQVTIISFGVDTDCAEAEELRQLGVRLVFIPPVSNSIMSKIINLTKGTICLRPYTIQKYVNSDFQSAVSAEVLSGTYDLVHLANVHMFPYAAECGTLPIVMDQHNVESLIWTRTRQLERRPLMKAILRLQELLMDRYEKRARQRVGLVLAVSSEDATLMKESKSPQAPILVIPNGVDTNYFTGSPSDERERGAIVFIGAMDWLPNADAAIHFVRETLPVITNVQRDVRFYIVGKNPPPAVRALAGPHVTVTGTVPDVRSYYRKAQAVVVPLRIGGGTRLKILEALSMGQALVSTSIGAEGLHLNPELDYLRADDSGTFAAATLALLEDPGRREAIGQHGQKTVRGMYSWDAVCAPLWEAYESLQP